MNTGMRLQNAWTSQVLAYSEVFSNVEGVVMTIRAVFFDMGGTIQTFSYTRELRLAATPGLQELTQVRRDRVVTRRRSTLYVGVRRAGALSRMEHPKHAGASAAAGLARLYPDRIFG